MGSGVVQLVAEDSVAVQPSVVGLVACIVYMFLCGVLLGNSLSIGLPFDFMVSCTLEDKSKTMV